MSGHAVVGREWGPTLAKLICWDLGTGTARIDIIGQFISTDRVLAWPPGKGAAKFL